MVDFYRRGKRADGAALRDFFDAVDRIVDHSIDALSCDDAQAAHDVLKNIEIVALEPLDALKRRAA